MKLFSYHIQPDLSNTLPLMPFPSHPGTLTLQYDLSHVYLSLAKLFNHRMQPHLSNTLHLMPFPDHPGTLTLQYNLSKSFSDIDPLPWPFNKTCLVRSLAFLLNSNEILEHAVQSRQHEIGNRISRELYLYRCYFTLTSWFKNTELRDMIFYVNAHFFICKMTTNIFLS